MSFAIGIVGLPNVGKSTLFKALTKKQVDIANYPFCTISPNVGVVPVPDERLAALAQIAQSAKTVPATVEFVDIAGLVKDAHKGEGLGNQFLSNIREVNAIVQVLRHFQDDNIIHVNHKVDPESDKETINLELIFADLQTVEKRLVKNEKGLHGKDKEAIKLQPILEKLKAGLESGRSAKETISDPDEAALIQEMNLLTFKPMLYVLNVDEDHIFQETDYIPISAKIEAELADLPAAEAKEYLKTLSLAESGLDKLIKKAYAALDLITFFTAGPMEAKAWTIKRGSLAPQAAGVIHTDFEKGFIRAEVISYQDFIACKGETKAKEKGLMRLEGKEYVMQDGDVCHFRFSA